MPIYAYRCTNCGHAQDVLRKISDPPLTVCPACGAPTFVKQVTAAGFQLKGSGWYVTDFRDKKPAKPAAGDGASESGKPADGGDAKEAPKGDAPAGKAEAPAAAGTPSPAPAPAAAPAAAAPAAAPTSTPTKGGS
jgi:putative FmdB family regulatory protein